MPAAASQGKNKPSRRQKKRQLNIIEERKPLIKERMREQVGPGGGVQRGSSIAWLRCPFKCWHGYAACIQRGRHVRKPCGLAPMKKTPFTHKRSSEPNLTTTGILQV